ncbi:threonine aldolase family protein [Paenibacillus methanolicus]|uniref:L-threonine aldolase n=1 Tax=Paenibacillus methanolicus TaxID=582686 RepID=A0A5S5C6B2_9BACL|nr:beta-eliminating lyase-related protein [Paenibacillus methanolicus]TYP74884.1 L-threonine aldolase [Paenibacillus methanolicus]
MYSSNTHSLASVFQQAEYKLGGHGPRNMDILKEAFASVDGETDADMYGQGKVIGDLERKMAGYLGKPSAVFFPSGTMAQQIALRIWSDRKSSKRVAYHPLSHLEIHEQRGLHELHGLEPVLLADADRLIRLDDVTGMPEDVACLLLELPQREIGGQLPAYEELEAIAVHCRDRGIKLHLDGARLFEVLPYYGKTAAEICALFDSVYISFYKGIGGIAGAILAGESDFSEESAVWKRRHGGDLISLYPYIVTADYYFDRRVDKMAHYWAGAEKAARLFNACRRVVTVPEVPVTNMFHVHIALPPEQVEDALVSVARASGVGLSSYVKPRGEGSCFELSIGDRLDLIPEEKLEQAFKLLDETLG